MTTPGLRRIALMLLQAAALALCGCFQWEYDVSENGVAFSQVRTQDGGVVIGQLREDTLIAGRPCRKGWVHLHPNGVPLGFTASRDIDLGRLRIPSGTWVFQDAGGVVTVCAFPCDTPVQGFVCHGTGGPKGAEAAFYPDGALKEFFLPRDTRIQGIPCKAGAFNEAVFLYESGRLKSCVLGEEVVLDGRPYQRGSPLQLDPEGRVTPRSGSRPQGGP